MPTETWIYPINKPPSAEEILLINMRKARDRKYLSTVPDFLWFKRQVQNKGPWDYKQRDRNFADFGNFNYGATGTAAGIPEEILLRLAGYAQIMAGTSTGSWTDLFCLSGPTCSYGDDPWDQIWIKYGINYAKSKGF